MCWYIFHTVIHLYTYIFIMYYVRCVCHIQCRYICVYHHDNRKLYIHNVYILSTLLVDLGVCVCEKTLYKCVVR